MRPCLIGDRAFRLTRHLMTTAMIAQQEAQPQLVFWHDVVIQTRRRIECAIGILKNRFAALKREMRLCHEDDIAYAIIACVILHKLSLSGGDLETDFEDASIEQQGEFVSEATDMGSKTRDALLQYFITTK